MGLFDKTGLVHSDELNRIIWILLSKTKEKEIVISVEDMVGAGVPGAGIEIKKDLDNRKIRLRAFDPRDHRATGV